MCVKAEARFPEIYLLELNLRPKLKIPDEVSIEFQNSVKNIVDHVICCIELHHFSNVVERENRFMEIFLGAPQGVPCTEDEPTCRSEVPMSCHVFESAIVAAPVEQVWRFVRILQDACPHEASGRDICTGLFGCVGIERLHGEGATQVSARLSTSGCSVELWQIGSVHRISFFDDTDWEIQLMHLSDAKRQIGFDIISRSDGVNVTSCQHRVALKSVTASDSTFMQWTIDFSNDADAAVILDAQYKRKTALEEIQSWFA